MSNNVLREFLVSLGFKVDEVGMKKFVDSVDGVTKTVKNVGLAVSAAAGGVVAGVKIISSQMENLYYASQRTGATVGNLMALRYAAGQIGLTADQAQGALENFARTLRLNPGTSSLLDSLGVKGGNPAERFNSFIEKMKSQQPYVAAAYAGLFGIDPDTLLMLENGLSTLKDEQKKYAESLSRWGINPDQAAFAGKEFNNSIRRVISDFDKLWIVIESKLVPVLTPLIDKFEKWAETHAGDVASAIADAVQKLANWIDRVDWDKTASNIDKVVEALGGVKGILIGLAAIKLAGVVSGVASLAGALGGLGAVAGSASLVGLVGTLGGLGLLGYGAYKAVDTIKDSTQGGHFVSRRGGARPDSAPAQSGGWSGVLDSIKHAFNYGGSGHFVSRSESNAHGNSSGATYDPMLGPPPRTPGIYDAYEAAKHSQDKYGIPAQIILAQYGLESGFGKRMPAGSNNPFGIKASSGQPYVEAETTEYINGIAQRVKQKFAKFETLADAFDEHARLLAKGKPYAEARRHSDDPGEFADALTGVYATDPAYGEKLKSVMASLDKTRLGGKSLSSPSVTIQQENTFHIDGSSDPQGTARAVGSEQSRVNGDMVRNFAGAFR